MENDYEKMLGELRSNLHSLSIDIANLRLESAAKGAAKRGVVR